MRTILELFIFPFKIHNLERLCNLELLELFIAIK